jgi:hypothetical protein
VISKRCAHSFTDIPAYEADLDAAGFRIVEVVNMTADWTEFTADRLVAFEADRCRYVAVHGSPPMTHCIGFTRPLSASTGRGAWGACGFSPGWKIDAFAE